MCIRARRRLTASWFHFALPLGYLAGRKVQIIQSERLYDAIEAERLYQHFSKQEIAREGNWSKA